MNEKLYQLLEDIGKGYSEYLIEFNLDYDDDTIEETVESILINDIDYNFQDADELHDTKSELIDIISRYYDNYQRS